jgi:hypothetical protein
VAWFDLTRTWGDLVGGYSAGHARNLAVRRALVIAQWPALEALGASPLAVEGALAWIESISRVPEMRNTRPPPP